MRQIPPTILSVFASAIFLSTACGITAAAEPASDTGLRAFLSEVEKIQAVELATTVLETIKNYTPEDYSERYDKWMALSTKGGKETLEAYRDKHMKDVVEGRWYETLSLKPETAVVTIEPVWPNVDTVSVKIEGESAFWTAENPTKRVTPTRYTVELIRDRRLQEGSQMATSGVMTDPIA